MFIELTKLRPRKKITLATSSITGLAKSSTQRGSIVQMTNGTGIEVFEFYRVVQWLLYRSKRVAIAQFSLDRDKLEWQSWCAEYMGDQKNLWQEAFDDCNYTHPNDIDMRKITSVDDDGCVTYDDGTKGWVFSYNIVDPDSGVTRLVQGLNHKPAIKINEDGYPV